MIAFVKALVGAVAAVPSPVRHALLMLVSALASWGLTTAHLPGLGSIVATAGSTGLIAYLLAWLTPLVTSYGVGKVVAPTPPAAAPSTPATP